ncbi:MAG: hypothetical protein JXA99_04575, partial [Candidatus Lokiarchaeota archaeon]|nr:hypothetical protein [Candidatus Lokiarchaeota archaeon]
MIDKKLISIFLIFIVIISSIIFILLFLLSPVNINPIDNTPPSVEIESPKNLKYNTTTQLLNISASDDIEVDTIWYNWDNINTTYTSEEYILFNEGSNTLYAYANDSTGNIGMTLVTFIIDIISPILQIISPLNTTYNTATQLLNISASDNNEIDIIWYNWNGTEIIYNSPHSILFNEGLNTIYA